MVTLLSGCINTYKLNAVRPAKSLTYSDGDDRPRVDELGAQAKSSFIVLLAQECRPADLDNEVKRLTRQYSDDPISDRSGTGGGVAGVGAATSGPGGARVGVVGGPAVAEAAGKDSTTGGGDKPKPPKFTRASVCVDRISAYAIDQCAWLTRRQNQVALQTSLFTSIATIGASVAANVAILAHSSTAAKSGTGLLAASVLSNSDKIKLLSTTTVPVDAMLKIGPEFAQVVGLVDDDIPTLDPLKTVQEWTDDGAHSGDPDRASLVGDGARLNPNKKKNSAIGEMGYRPDIKKLARIHDAVLSACTGNAIGLTR